MSIPVHEDAAVVHDQLNNVEQFLEDPVTVLHVSSDFDVDLNMFATSERSLVNPERRRTGWGSGIIAWAHVSNLRHALATVDFDYALIAASNELYVRRGVENYLARHAAGGPPSDSDGWPLRARCMGDGPLLRMLREHGRSYPKVGQVEGSFFRRDVLEAVLEVLGPVVDATPWDDGDFALSMDDEVEAGRRPRVSRYPREEIYFPTAVDICGADPLGGAVTYLNWDRQLDLSEAEIDAVHRGEMGEGLYSVKRVPRQMDAALRCHIRGLA